MSRKPSSRDLRKLSAYLDGALSASAAGKLEKRLARDPNLRAALEQLRQTQAILRRTPSRRAPRSFTLTPQMVAQRPPLPRLVPALNYAAVFALLLLFVSFLPPIGFGAMAPAAEPEMMMEAAPMMQEMPAEEEPAEEEILPAEEPAEVAPENIGDAKRATAPVDDAEQMEEEGAQAEKTFTAATATIVPTPTPTPAFTPTPAPLPPQAKSAPLLTSYQRVLIILLGVFVILSWGVRRVAISKWKKASK